MPSLLVLDGYANVDWRSSKSPPRCECRKIRSNATSRWPALNRP